MLRRFTEDLRDWLGLLRFVGERSAIDDFSVLATILPRSDPILRAVVTRKLLSGTIASRFDPLKPSFELSGWFEILFEL